MESHGTTQTDGDPARRDEHEGPASEQPVAPESEEQAREAAKAAEHVLDKKKPRSLAPLRMVYRESVKYPAQIGWALLALVVTSAATLAIPWRFKVTRSRARFSTCS